MNRVPFDYDKIAKGYRVITRDGVYATEVHKFETVRESHKIFAVIDAIPIPFYENGRMYTIQDCDDDLFMEAPVVERWVVMNPSYNTYSIWNSLEDAEKRVRLRDEANDKGNYIQKETYSGTELIKIELVK